MSELRTIFRNRRLMLSLGVIVGVLLIFQTFFPTGEGKFVYDELTYMASVLASFLSLSGVLQLFRYHIPAVIKKERFWQVNAWTIFCALVIIVLGLAYGVTTPFVDLVMYRGVMRVVATAMTAAQAWIAASVVMKYTSFRNADLAAFSLAIFCVVVFQTPLLVAVAPQIYSFASWMRINVSGTANLVSRAGQTFGLIIICVRILLGQESGFLGRME